MTVEEIAILRAEEQMRTVRMDEPVTHDPWAIRPSEVQGRPHWRRERCLGCGGSAWQRTSYCRACYDRIRRGLPVDAQSYVLTRAEMRRMSSGVRFGLPRSHRRGGGE